MEDCLRTYLLQLICNDGGNAIMAYGKVYDDEVQPGDIACAIDDHVLVFRVNVIIDDIL